MNPDNATGSRLAGMVCLTGLYFMCAASAGAQLPATGPTNHWEWCGWGGGGFYRSAAFHPAQDGVIYMGGDVSGAYKTVDHGNNWRMINQGLASYEVLCLAVDRKSPQTVYASTPVGLHKSIDAGEHWRLLPLTGPKELNITTKGLQSVHAVAVDPTDSKIVYAGTPEGKIYKSLDGAETWKLVREPHVDQDQAGVSRLQFGKVNGATDGGVYINNPIPAGIKPEDCVGIGFTMKGDGTQLPNLCIVLNTANGPYRSKNIGELLKETAWKDVVLKREDFGLDPGFVKKNPEKAAALPAAPDLSAVKQLSFSAVGLPPNEMSVLRLKRLFLALTHTADGKTGTATTPILQTIKDFATDKKVSGSYGNMHVENGSVGLVATVVVSEKSPAMVAAATLTEGIVLSEDGGLTWKTLPTPAKAFGVAIAAQDERILFGVFATDGIMQSTDKGRTWTACMEGIKAGDVFSDIAISPTDAQEVHAIAAAKAGWSSKVYSTRDGGKTWAMSNKLATDFEHDPTTLDLGGAHTAGMSWAWNIAMNPSNPREVFVAANWRPFWSEDGGATWSERVHGADITCFNDIRFHNGRTYVCAHDEGAFVSDNAGRSWRQMWPTKYNAAMMGHFVQLAVTGKPGHERIINTCSPWNAGLGNRVILSHDAGKTFKVVTEGLPDYVSYNNCMWGRSYPRALAVDPEDSNIVYLGMDGDPEPGAGRPGNGIFKSADGGNTWKQLPAQPGSRCMFNGLLVDPADSQRLFWGACKLNGGVYRSENGGHSWQKVFDKESNIWNMMITPGGTIYTGDFNLWQSVDHGTTWKQVSSFTDHLSIAGMACDPADETTLWISRINWGCAKGAIDKTTDGGANWQDITGDLPYLTAFQMLRFNPETRELWGAAHCLFKIKQ